MPTQIERAAITHVASHEPTAAHGRALGELIEQKYPGAIARARVAVEKKRQENLFTGNPPAWAKRLFLKHRSGGTLRWRRSRSKWGTGSGHCSWSGNIVVTARGTEASEHKIILLHELAHNRAGTYCGHGPGFYDELLKLAKAEGMFRRVADFRSHGTGMRSAAKRLRRA